MNFINDDGEPHTYSRAIVSSTTSEYRVDNEVVAPGQYRAALEEIRIFIRARNFLVYQGAVEQIAMQSPKELTALIEELSKSSENKAEYERLKLDMQKAEVDAQDNMSRRRDVALEKKEAKAEKEQAKNYQAVRSEFTTRNRDLYLAQIYSTEQARRKGAARAREARLRPRGRARAQDGARSAGDGEASRHAREVSRDQPPREPHPARVQEGCRPAAAVRSKSPSRRASQA